MESQTQPKVGEVKEETAVKAAPPAQAPDIVNSIIQKVIALALMDEEELRGAEGMKIVKELRKDVKKLILSGFRR